MPTIPPSLADNVHIPKLLGSMAKAEAELDRVTPIVESVQMGAPAHVDKMEPRLRKAGIDLSVASTHAARAGLEELMGDLTGAASALIGTSELAQLEGGAFTFTPDVAPDVLARTTELQGKVGGLIGDIRGYIERGAKPPTEEPPAEEPPTEQPPAEEPPAEQPPTEQPPTERPPAEEPPTDPDASGGGGTPPADGGAPITAHPPVKQWDAPPPMTINPDGTYHAQLATTDGVIGVDLLPKVAPNAVNNFVFLANEGFYKDTPIHRVIKDFMIQSGDPTATGTGGPGYTIPDDPVPADMKYEPGVVAMANTGEPNSGGSQFFIMHGDTPLPPTYTIFGKVTEGMDVLDKLAKHEVVPNEFGEPSKPVDPIGIRDITITGP